MHRFSFILLLLSSVTLLTAQKIEIPKGVNYKYTSDENNDKAKTMLAKQLTAPDYSINSGMVIIGPRLWLRYKEIPVIRDIEAGNTTFQVPILDKKGKPKETQLLKGKLVQTPADFKVVWNQVVSDFKGANITFRKLTPTELNYYWSIISFDIDEPLLIVEGGKYKLLVNLLPKDLKIAWLDEVE